MEDSMASRDGESPSDDVSRAEHAHSRLMGMLRSGELRAGQRLREVDLAKRLGVSRTPVREALRRIDSDGLAQAAPGRGLIVAEYDKQQVRELYALRAVLEGAAASMATQHASPAEIELMNDILEQCASALNVPDEMMRMNIRFHQAIHQAAHNRYLEKALAQMSDSLALLPGTTFAEVGRAKEAHAEHRAILAALEQRLPEQAESLARQHIARAGAARLRLMFKGHG